MPNELETNQLRLSALEDTVSQLAELGASLSAQELLVAPGDDAWSVNDVLAHLRACADVWGGYITTILAEDAPAIRAISPRTWARRVNYQQLAFNVSFDAFQQQRAALVATLRVLPPRDWAREAHVTKNGKTQRLSVAAYADMLLTHEQAHIRQLHDIASALRERR